MCMKRFSEYEKKKGLHPDTVLIELNVRAHSKAHFLLPRAGFAKPFSFFFLLLFWSYSHISNTTTTINLIRFLRRRSVFRAFAVQYSIK